LTNAAWIMRNDDTMTLIRPKPAGGLIAALYARGLLDYLREQGVDPARLYPRERVIELEQARGHSEIPQAEWIAMFAPAIAALDDPNLPLKAGASLRIRHIGALGHVLMNCATLEEVYQQLARYIRLIGQIGQPTLDVRGDRAHLHWHWPFDSPPEPAVVQFMMAARAMFMRWLSNRPELKLDAWFQFPAPADLEPYRRIFGGELYFGQSVNKMVFPHAYMRLPVVSADEELRQQVEAQAQLILQRLSGEPPVLRELKSLLARNLANGRVSLADSAQAMGVSERTLQRRLAEAGVSFQNALDQVRQAQAEALLRDPSVSLTQITFLLGYTEQSTFHNAFRRWTGYSPGAWRRGERVPYDS
jgi:AraC-like DNA-binding protein